MPSPNPPEKMDIWISNILRLGVTISALLVLLGGILYLSHYGFSRVEYAAFKGEPGWLKGLPGILTSALSWHSRAIIQLGLICLVATPILRIMLSLAMFAKQKDFKYVLITAIALALLGLSLVFGR